MSVAAYKAVWQHSQQSGSHLAVLLCLADHADDNGRCWPGIPRISQLCRISERQAKRIIKTLESDGELSIEQGGSGPRDTNKYRILLIDKGDTHDTHSSNKGDTDDNKGDTHDTLMGVTHDTHNALRVTPVTSKGDTDVTRSVLEPINNNNYEAAVMAFFEGLTGFTPPPYNTPDYEAKWLQPIQAIMRASKDDAEIEKRITEAVNMARGNNPTGKSYTISSPKSILAFALNLNSTSSNGQDPATAWDELLKVQSAQPPGKPFKDWPVDDKTRSAWLAIGGPTVTRQMTDYNQARIRKQFIEAITR